jgi:DNA-binding LytR/AlgR family response regulator
MINKVLIHSRGVVNFLDPNEVVFIEAKGSYSSISLINGDTILISKNLKYTIERFIDYSFLFRVDRTYAINLHYVKKLTNLSPDSTSLQLELKGGYLLPLAAKSKKKFLDAFNKKQV